MLIGVPKEIKPQESRIGLTPYSARERVNYGHDVLVENRGIITSIINNALNEKGRRELV